MTGPMFDWIQDKWYRVNEYFEGFPEGTVLDDEQDDLQMYEDFHPPIDK